MKSKMIKTLAECEVGDIVRLYCIGLRCFDDELSTVIENNSHFYVKVKSASGCIHEFVPDTECIVLNKSIDI